MLWKSAAGERRATFVAGSPLHRATGVMMSELDDLPSWAGRSTEEVQLPTGPPDEVPTAEEAALNAEEVVPDPPAMPAENQPEIAAPTAADQAPPAPPSPPAITPDPPVEAAAPAEKPVLAAQAPPAEPAVVQPAEPAAMPPAAPAVVQQAAPAAMAQAPAEPIVAQQAAPVITDPQPTAVAQPMDLSRKRSRLRPILLGLLGLAVIGGAAAVGYGLASRDGDSTEASGAAASEEPASPEATADDAATDGDTTDTDAATATDTDTGTETDDATTATDGDGADAEGAGGEDGTETVTVEVDPAEGEDADADAGTDEAGDGDGALNDGDRQAVFRDGMVYLSGAVPSEEVGAAIVAKAEAVVGPGNVVNEYTIDPTTTIEPGSSAPLFVEDVVLFQFNSVEVASPFLPILDLGTLLLRQNPQATITVVTRTDAVGSAEVNLEVARQRAQAVVNYWLGQGVNADQIIADPRGEEGASEEDDPETAALQRRAEFIITGLLD